MDLYTAEILSKAELFKGLSTQEILRLFRDIPVNPKNHGKGSILAFRGDDYSRLLFLIKGKVSAEIDDASGKTLRVETIEAPAPLAAGILFAEEAALPVTILAATEVTTITLSKKNLLETLQKNEALLNNFLEDVGNKIVFLADKMALFRFKTLRQKFCCYLLSLEDRQKNQSIRLPYTKEVLSELFGVARPSLSRVFLELEQEGLITQEGRLVHLLNMEELREQLGQGDSFSETEKLRP